MSDAREEAINHAVNLHRAAGGSEVNAAAVVQDAKTLLGFLHPPHGEGTGEGTEAPTGLFLPVTDPRDEHIARMKTSIERLELLIHDKDAVNDALKTELAAAKQQVEIWREWRDLAERAATRKNRELAQPLLAGAVLIDGYADEEEERLGGKRIVSRSGQLTNWVQGIREGAQLLRDESARKPGADDVSVSHTTHTCPVVGCGSVHLPSEPDGEPQQS